jgi:hypothetical protein
LFPNIASRDPALDRSLWARINLEGRARNLPAGGNHLFVGRPVLIREAPVAPREVKLASGVRYGRFQDGSAYELFVIRRTHNQMLRDTRVNLEMLRWIEGAFGVRLPGIVKTDYPGGVLGTVLLGLATLPLCAIGARLCARRMRAPPPAAPRGGPAGHAWMALALAATAAGSAVAVSWTARSIPALLRMTTTRFQFVPHVALAGVVALALWAALGRTRRWTTRSPARWTILAAPCAFLLLYLGAGLFAGSQFFHTVLDLDRVPRMLYLAACFAPLAALLSFWLRGRPAYREQLVGVPLLAGCWLGVIHLLASAWERPMRFEAMALAGLALAAEALATPLYVELRSPAAAAALVALTLGWFSAVAYPLLP